MHRRSNLQNNKAIFCSILLGLVISFNCCLGYQYYDHPEYTYNRNARDYQYEDDYGEDYDKTGKWKICYIHTHIYIFIVAIYTKTIYIVDDNSYLILSSIRRLKSTNDTKVQKIQWLTSIILTERNEKRFGWIEEVKSRRMNRIIKYLCEPQSKRKTRIKVRPYF